MQNALKFSDCCKSIRKQNRPSCRKTCRPHFVFVWFLESKFRDLSEYSHCVQNVLAKNCLPCQILYKQKKFCRARKGLGTSIGMSMGGTVASWLARSTPERALRVRALAGEIVLCSWARHFTLTVPLSTQVYKDR